MARIDLTSDELFTHKRTMRNPLINVKIPIKNEMKKLLPNSLFVPDKDYNMKVETKLVTGSRKDVLRHLEIIEMMNGSLCERCGSNFQSIIMSTLCRKCNNQIEMEIRVEKALNELESYI